MILGLSMDKARPRAPRWFCGGQEREGVMGRRLDDVGAALSAGRRARIDARFETLKAEVEGPGELRTGRGQGAGRDRVDPEDHAALGVEDREAGGHVSVDLAGLRRSAISSS